MTIFKFHFTGTTKCICLLILTLSLSQLSLAEARFSPATATPKTEKEFSIPALNDFRFVIFGDRTGGHRPDVFKNAVSQVNLLQPEFVIGVGDSIEGYTEDRKKLTEEWDQFDSLVKQLEAPFFYVAGNHDLSNSTMLELWKERYGRDYYHFRYKNTLFLVLNTEDPPVALPPEIRQKQLALEAMMAKDPESTQKRILAASKSRGEAPKLPGSVAISNTQVSYFSEVLNSHQNVDWTFVIMHKPAWLYGNTAFSIIEDALGTRPYTVIAGHEHYYSYEKRHGHDYVDIGTTGGVWLQDGDGRFDHITQITMKDGKPVIANIKLEGLFGVELR
jgi:hypothetical protein